MMIPTTTLDQTVTGSLHGVVIPMGISPSATAHIMGSLIDLYSDRIMAFIREVSTNAYDSHLAAGHGDRAIEVTLPSSMSPYFKVRDFGVGLNVDDIRDIYSQYGESTKRQSNLFNGTLGFGCKAPLTYTSQFSVTSVKGGIKSEVSVSRTADGGEMEVIDFYATDEPNGVEITIPIKRDDVWTVKSKVEQFFQYWKPGTALVNGREPDRITGREVAPNLFMVDGQSHDLIVMGNVAYPVPDGHNIWEAESDGYYYHTFFVVYYAAMGEVTFTPSREKLQTTKNTVKTIERVRDEFKKNFVNALQAEVEAEETHQKAWEKSREIRSRHHSHRALLNFTYRGETIPNGIEAPKVTGQVYDSKTNSYVQGMVPSQWYTYDANGGSNHSSIDTLTGKVNEVLVLNAPRSAPTTHQKVKMRRAMEKGLLPGPRLVLVDKHPSPKWLGDSKVVDWSVIRDIRLTAPKAKAAREEFGVLQDNGYIKDEMIDKSKAIAYVSPRTWRGESTWRKRSHYDAMNRAGWTVIELGENRQLKFQRENPHTMPLRLAAQKVYNDYFDALTDKDKTILGASREDMSLAMTLRSTGLDIDDPSVLDFVKKTEGVDKHDIMAPYERINDLVLSLGGEVSAIGSVTPFMDYPLLRNMSSNQSSITATHMIIYINAVYGS